MKNNRNIRYSEKRCFTVKKWHISYNIWYNIMGKNYHKMDLGQLPLKNKEQDKRPKYDITVLLFITTQAFENWFLYFNGGEQ